MTFVGHSLTGISIGIVFLPKNTSRLWRIIYFSILILIANIPDFSFPYWGHDRYDISHSLFVNLILMLVLFLAVRPFIKRTSVLWAGVATWLSHLLLDSFYNHGHGSAMFWPLSRARLALPVSLFSVLPDPPAVLSLQNLNVYSIEFLAYGSLVVFAILIRYLFFYLQMRDIR